MPNYLENAWHLVAILDWSACIAPISLYSTLYKLITKALVNKIELVLNSLAHACQACFSIIKRKEGMDKISKKVYDNIEWDCFQWSLQIFKFPWLMDYSHHVVYINDFLWIPFRGYKTNANAWSQNYLELIHQEGWHSYSPYG